ncbi:MAG: cytochrome c biogenesis CcdA family protein [Candidatus Woesearchaeota archaeon]
MSISIAVAFFGGLATFLSPCVLPLLPSFFAYLAGGVQISRMRYFLNSVFFVLGLSLVFAFIGILFQLVFARTSFIIELWLSRIGGIFIMLFALHILGALPLSFLNREYKVSSMQFSSTYITSFLFGAVFALGWTPCFSAILGGILTLAIVEPTSGFFLLFAYALGLGIPFLLVGIFSTELLLFLKKHKQFFWYFQKIFAVVLLGIGFLAATQSMSLIADFTLALWYIGR